MSRPPSSALATPNANVPPSQNTAPVIKFRCLFTHDIRRKAKRWQDGYLKFHTFNKRAMVYDDSGNFIGDHHWSESSEIQDGDELELDKGVLIQVSECMERTETDLSALFEKRKASQESPQQEKSSAPLPPSARTPLPSQSTPLKSLNDLLGIKRPSIGRAVLPQSPYEQRYPQARPEIYQSNGPPAKRQKQQLNTVPPQGESAQKKARNSSEVIELEDSAPQIQRARPLPSMPLMSSGPRHVNRLQKSSISRNAIPAPVSSRPAIDQQNRSRDVELSVPSAAASFDEPQQERVEPPSRASVSVNTTQVSRERRVPDFRRPNSPVNPLRMSVQKSRPKLMYKERPLKAASSSTTETVQASSNQSNDEPLFTQSNADFAISASTLAILEDTDDNGVPRNTRDSDFITRQIISPKESTSQSLRRTVLYNIPSHSAIHGSAASPAGVDLLDDDSPSPPQVNAESHSDGNALTGNPTLRRSHSDLSAMLPDSHLTVSATDTFVPEPVGDAHSMPAVRRNETKPFRKSYSDTTALRNADQHRHGPSLPVATSRPAKMEPIHHSDRGPWTVDALDFFDWWPPGRPKP